MRTHNTGNITIEYPDAISFAFNPTVVNVYGENVTKAEIEVTDSSGKVYTEKREIFKNNVFFDISQYIQCSFGAVNEIKIPYSVQASDSALGMNFTCAVTVYSASSVLVDSFSFSTFAIWGAMRVGERFNGSRNLTWFKNYPFSVGIYAAAAGSVQVKADGVVKSSIQLSKQAMWNVFPYGVTADDSIEFYLPGSGTAASVFDHTFDYTFKGLLNTPVNIVCKVDDSDCGVYLRWIGRHGMYCYWLFQSGDETRQVVNDGEFLRNNMEDYSYKNGYHGGTGRKQRKTENDTLPVCAPLVDSDTWDFLFELVTSPVVDMFAGYDGETPQWKGVNVSVENFVKTKDSLQDFVCTIILPELNLQSL